MDQTKLESFLEALVNTFVGFWISFLAWPIIGWIVGLDYTGSQHWQAVLLFTILSVGRGYVIRRWFNTYFKLFCHRLAFYISRIL